MHSPSATRLNAVLWLVLSPMVAVMALISTVESLTVYYAQVTCFGLWSVLGILAGIGGLLRQSWATTLQKGLGYVAIAYLLLAAIGMVGFLISAFLNGGVANQAQGWAFSGLILLFLLAVVLLARSKGSKSAHTSSDA